MCMCKCDCFALLENNSVKASVTSMERGSKEITFEVPGEVRTYKSCWVIFHYDVSLIYEITQ